MATRGLPWPPVASRGLSRSPVFSRCLPWPPVASRGPPLPHVVSCCLPWSTVASRGLSWSPMALSLAFRSFSAPRLSPLAYKIGPSVIVIHQVCWGPLVGAFSYTYIHTYIYIYIYTYILSYPMRPTCSLPLSPSLFLSLFCYSTNKRSFKSPGSGCRDLGFVRPPNSETLLLAQSLA